MPRKKKKPKPPSWNNDLQDTPSSPPSTSEADEGKITTVEIQMTADEVPKATKLTFLLRDRTVISVHVNDDLPLAHSSLWNCSPTCCVDLTDQLCKALCQFDNKSKRYFKACLSRMENGNLAFVFGHDKKDEALNMSRNNEVVKDMMKELFKQIDVEMANISVKIKIPAPPKNPTTREGFQLQETAGRSDDRTEKPDNSAERETATRCDVTITGVDGTGTATRSIVGGIQKIGKMIQVQGDLYEGLESSEMADQQEQSKIESKSFQVRGKIRHCRTKVTRSKDGKKIKEMHIEFQDDDNGETYNSTCKSQWTSKTKSNKQVLNVDPSLMVMEPLYELKDATRQTNRAKLKEVRSGSIVFVFEHETKEDAIQMIKRHQEVEHLILRCLRQLDSEVEDITLHITLEDLSQSERKVDTTEPSPLKRKAIISDPISTGKDYPFADTSQTCSGEHMPHKKRRKLTDWPSSPKCQTCLQPIPHLQTSATATSGEELHDCSNKQKCQEIVRNLKQQIKYLKIELDNRDAQMKDYEKSQLAETRMVLWMRSESPPLTETSGYCSSEGGAASMSDVHDQQIESLHAKEHESQLPHINPGWEVRDGSMKLISFNRNSMLIQACLEKKVFIVKQLLTNGSVDVNTRTKHGWTPVLIAAFTGSMDLLTLLVKEECELSVKLDDGTNILHAACWSDNVDTAEYLLSHGIADIDSTDKIGRTPVMCAAEKGNKKVFDLLVRKGCNLLVVDDVGRNILHAACLSDNVDIIEYLSSCGIADTESRSKRGRTPVTYAAEQGNKKVFDLLVCKGCNFSVVDD